MQYPILSSEWYYEKNSPFTPDMFSPGSHQKVWWRCRNNPEHVWLAEIKSRVVGNECPFCSGYYPSKDYNLEVLFPEIAKEWHPTKNGDLSPTDVTPGSERKVWWKCSFGHSWSSTVYNRTKLGSGCPVCYKYGIKSPAEGQTKLKEFE